MDGFNFSIKWLKVTGLSQNLPVFIKRKHRSLLGVAGVLTNI
jgi:hypothetical protein